MGKQTLQIECDPEPDEIRPGMFRMQGDASVKKIFFSEEQDRFPLFSCHKINKATGLQKGWEYCNERREQEFCFRRDDRSEGCRGDCPGYQKTVECEASEDVSGSRSGRRSAWSDFCNFRIMLFPQIIKILWFLGMIVSTLGGLFLIIGGISRGAWGSAGLGLLVLLFSPIVTHLLLEFTMVPFSIMEILREIRDDGK